MKKKIWIEVNHDGPLLVDDFIDDIEKELGIDMLIKIDDYRFAFPCWIDSDDFKNCEKNES